LFQLLEQNEDAMGVMFTYDLSHLDLVARFCAIASNLSVDLVRNPSRLKTEEELEKREKGLEALSSIRERLLIFDQSHMEPTLQCVENEIETIRKSFKSCPLFICFDPVLSLSCPEEPGEDRSEAIMRNLKRFTRKYQVGILATADLHRGAREHRPALKDLEKARGLLFGADFIGLMYNDSLNDFSTPFLEWEWGTDDMMVPVVEMNVVKNNHSAFLGRIYYHFYNSITRYKECLEPENEYYNEMLGNLDYYDPEAGTKKKSNLQKRVYEAKPRKYEGNFNSKKA
jgi:replicative DNA helicase